MTIKRERDDRWDRLSRHVQELMAKHNVPGVSIGIYNAGEIISDGFGVTSVENPLPVTNKTLFQIGSITKTVTGTAVMRLAEMGEIELDAPVRSYLPDFKVSDEEASAKATIRHLLTHTSGWLGDFFIDTGSGEDAGAKYAERMADLEQISPVGSRFSYNNAGFYLLGYLITLITERPFEEALNELVVEPLQLENCFLRPADVMVHRFAVGHRVQDGEAIIAKPWALPRAVYPAGGLICNVDELLKYARFHLGDGKTPEGVRLLQSESLAKMQTPQANIWRDKESVGLSWFINVEQGTKIISHGGGTVGQVTTLQFIPDHEFAFAILTNAGSGDHIINATRKWILKEYVGIETDEAQPVDVPEDKMKECEGRYTLPRLKYIDIRLLGERLIAQEVPTGGFPTEDTPPPPAPPPYTLAFVEEDRLVAVDGPFKDAKMELIRDATGAVKWLRRGRRLYLREPIE